VDTLASASASTATLVAPSAAPPPPSPSPPVVAPSVPSTVPRTADDECDRWALGGLILQDGFANPARLSEIWLGPKVQVTGLELTDTVLKTQKKL
jgi:hypothetical protein